MAWLSELPGMGAAEERTAKALNFPVGAASPLWLAFGAAGSVASTSSVSPAAMSARAFLAFRMGMGQVSPLVSSVRVTVKRTQSP